MSDSETSNKIDMLFWRNSNIVFDNLNTLVATLEKKTTNEFLRKINDCEDERVLKFLIKNDKDIIDKCSKEFVKTLWE